MKLKKQSKQQHNNHHAGNALVFAMLIVMTTAIIAYALIETSSFAIRRVQHLNTTDACTQVIHATEALAIDLLKQEETENIGATTDLNQRWAEPFTMELSKEMRVSAEIIDLQGQYNLNALREKVSSNIYAPSLSFVRLLISLHIQNAQNLEKALTIWVGDDMTVEDANYLSRNPPYSVAHLPLASITELNLIEGYSPSIIDTLKPYVSAVPPGSKINVNTASAQVLAAMLDAPIDLVQTLLDERAAYPFTDTNAFADRARGRGINIQDQSELTPLLDVNSQYFLLKVQATCQKTSLVSYSFIKRLSSDSAYVYQRTSTL